MNVLTTKDRAQILSILTEGNSINATSRITGVSKNTILKLLVHVGSACVAYQDRVMRNLNCKTVEADETWAFVGMKERNVPKELKNVLGYGDVYTWVAIDADSKLIPCWHVGTRDAESGSAFINDLASRLANRIQLSTDAHKVYLRAIRDAFENDIDYGQIIKMYGAPPGAPSIGHVRFSPAECTGTKKRELIGEPDQSKISTSYVERQNLTMRMNMRRFTRLTNVFSKKLENHMHAISLHFMHYNFCRIHQTLRVTPAMEAGLDDHVWSMEEVVMMADTQDVTAS
jgi:IS1 family transposase